MPIIQGATVPEEQSGIGIVLDTLLNSAAGYMKGKSDRAYRLSAAKMLGVDPSELGHFQREEIKELVKKKKFEPQKWEPSTKEEALEFEREKVGATQEKEMRANYANYLGRATSAKVTPMSFAEFKQSMENTTEVPLKTHGWQNVGILPRIMAAITPTATPEEMVLGELRPGGIFNPPQVDNAQASATFTDPIAVRIRQAQAQGITNEIIAANLREKGIDPAKYGL